MEKYTTKNQQPNQRDSLPLWVMLSGLTMFMWRELRIAKMRREVNRFATLSDTMLLRFPLSWIP